MREHHKEHNHAQGVHQLLEQLVVDVIRQSVVNCLGDLCLVLTVSQQPNETQEDILHEIVMVREDSHQIEPELELQVVFGHNVELLIRHITGSYKEEVDKDFY